MNGKEIFQCIKEGKMPPRIPFVPTIYEHAAKVIGKTPSQVAKDEDLLVKSQLSSYEAYGHDLISVGLDIYNIECEALGAKVLFCDNEDIPSIKDAIIHDKEDLKQLCVPNPEKDGRMPIFLNATERINKQIGNEVIVNGTIVGPFTLAALLRGFENYVMDLMFDIDFALDVMNFAKEVGLSYARSFIKRGVGLSINESWISPPLLSPNLYQKYVMNVEKDLIEQIKGLGQSNVALISGGNTTSIAPYMIKTGTSLLMADYNTDQAYYKKLCKEYNVSLRASIESKTVEEGIEQDMKDAAAKVIGCCRDYEKFVFGCGVVSYNTPVQNVQNLKKIIEKFNDIG